MQAAMLKQVENNGYHPQAHEVIMAQLNKHITNSIETNQLRQVALNHTEIQMASHHAPSVEMGREFA